MATVVDRAIILLSGGLDSATVLAIAREEGLERHALTLSYGQRHIAELEAARRVAAAIGVERHLELAVDLSRIGGSALTADIPVPRDRDPVAVSEAGVPITYVPARNTVMLSLAVAWAEVLRARVVLIGVNALDYSGYPDCRPEFVAAFQEVARLGTKAGLEGDEPRIRAPLIEMTKPEIIRRGLELGVDYGLTTSCYDPAPDGAACGSCDSCSLRRRGFEAAGVPDPTRYAAQATW
jgi:7-cyano-7-deazaguanine synthase